MGEKEGKEGGWMEDGEDPTARSTCGCGCANRKVIWTNGNVGFGEEMLFISRLSDEIGFLGSGEVNLGSGGV